MCEERERAVSNWLATHRGCETDSDCELSGDQYGGCVAEFVCSFALNANVDRAEFGREARQRISAYVDACYCAIADCGKVMGARCSPTTSLCEPTLAAPSKTPAGAASSSP